MDLISLYMFAFCLFVALFLNSSNKTCVPFSHKKLFMWLWRFCTHIVNIVLYSFTRSFLMFLFFYFLMVYTTVHTVYVCVCVYSMYACVHAWGFLYFGDRKSINEPLIGIQGTGWKFPNAMCLITCSFQSTRAIPFPFYCYTCNFCYFFSLAQWRYLVIIQKSTKQ